MREWEDPVGVKKDMMGEDLRETIPMEAHLLAGMKDTIGEAEAEAEQAGVDKAITAAVVVVVVVVGGGMDPDMGEAHLVDRDEIEMEMVYICGIITPITASRYAIEGS